MRASLYLPVAVLVSLTIVSSVFAQSRIRWTNNLHEAQQIAQRDGRLILIHFYTNWCGPCRKLEHDVFPRTDVAAAMMKNYVPVMIDAEQFRDIAAHYRVDRFPMDVITDASGQVVFRASTPPDPIGYIRFLDDVASDHRFATPGYAVASRGAAADPNRFTRHSTQPQRQDQQRFSQSVPPAGQRPFGQGYGGSVPPGPAASGAPGARDSRGMPSQLAGESGYGPRYAGQAPAPTQPPAPTYTPPPAPRETYNPHVAPSNGLSRDDTRFKTPVYQGQGSSPTPGDYRGTYQPTTPDRKSGWQTGPRQYAERGMPSDNTNAREPFVNRQPSMADTRDPRFASTPVRPQRQEPPLALDGFCPVTLALRGNTETAIDAWQQGDSQWGAIHRGRTYLFTSQRYQKMFLADPDRYSPMLSGYDPIRYIDRGELVPGLRQHGMWVGGKMYLFADEPSLERFAQSAESRAYYAQKVHEVMMRAGR